MHLSYHYAPKCTTWDTRGCRKGVTVKNALERISNGVTLLLGCRHCTPQVTCGTLTDWLYFRAVLPRNVWCNSPRHFSINKSSNKFVRVASSSKLEDGTSYIIIPRTYRWTPTKESKLSLILQQGVNLIYQITIRLRKSMHKLSS